MRLSTLSVGALLLVPALAAAEQHNQSPASGMATGAIITGPATINDLKFARQMLPPTGVGDTTIALAQSKVIYLNKNGVTLTPGVNNSRANVSSIVPQQVAIPAWQTSATTWAATVSCMRDLFAPFDVSVVETDPGQTPHIEAVFGGSPALLGMEAGVAGVSPFTQNCAIIENAVVFTFSAILPQDARLNCEIMAQEVAHAYGLDHQLLASDPMTYLDYTGNRSFKNQTASCGEDVARPCGIGGSQCRPNQNSVTLLTERLGAKVGDIIAPTGSITSPTANSQVPPGFNVYAAAEDNLMVRSGKLFVDGTVVQTIDGGGPFTFTTPATIAEGPHRLKIEVSDGINVVTTTEITVTVAKGAAPPPVPPGMGTGPGTGGDTGGDNEISGGCSTGRSSSSLLLGLALIGLIIRRRR